MFVLKQRFANDSSADNSEEDVSEGDLLQVTYRLHINSFTFTQIPIGLESSFQIDICRSVGNS